jgi:hypothetical protein
MVIEHQSFTSSTVRFTHGPLSPASSLGVPLSAVVPVSVAIPESSVGEPESTGVEVSAVPESVAGLPESAEDFPESTPGDPESVVVPESVGCVVPLSSADAPESGEPGVPLSPLLQALNMATVVGKLSAAKRRIVRFIISP